MNVAQLVMDSVKRCAEYPAVYYEGQVLTNVEHLRRAERLATVLQSMHVAPGDRVAIMMPNRPDVTAAFHAAWRIGAVIVPMPPQLLASEAHYIIASSVAAVVLSCPTLFERLREATAGLPEIRHLVTIGPAEGAENIEPCMAAARPIQTLHECPDDELALLLYTSGTTGNPKGVMLTHGNLRTNALAVAERYRPAPQTMTLHVLPLSHSFGVLCMNIEAVIGLKSVILPRFDLPHVFHAIQEFRVQRFSAVPTMLIAMCHFHHRQLYDCSSLEHITSGGAALPEQARLDFERLFGCPVRSGYGLSETAPTVSCYADGEAARPGSSGRPISGVKVRILGSADQILPAGESGKSAFVGQTS